MKRSIFNFKIIYDDGREIDLADTPYWITYFRIDGTTSEEIAEQVEGRPGTIRKKSTLTPRQIRVGIQVFGLMNMILI